MWAALRWIVLIVAILFSVGYVGILMLVPPISNLETAYPKFWGKLGFYIHAFPGSVWLILGALQQFSWIRAKNPKAHHVMGYIGLVSLFISIIGGCIICFSGETEGGLTLAIDGVVMFIGWGICVSESISLNMPELINEFHRAALAGTTSNFNSTWIDIANGCFELTYSHTSSFL
jgi:hypothetical protein